MEPGTLIIGRYEVLRCLGSGGMATVFLAYDRKAHVKVALKVLSDAMLDSPKAALRFRNEFGASSRVRHDNVLRAYDYIDIPELQAYTMEPLEGGSLAALMEKGPVDRQRAVRILIDVAAGLAAIHATGIIHRDLKPQNVLLDARGAAKICDFGVSIPIGAESLTPEGMLVGTPKYVAPEYVTDGRCTPLSDIYAFGVMAYELLAGESPFESMTRDAVVLERFDLTRERLNEMLAGCPAQIAEVVVRCMSLEPSERYQYAGEIAVDLERALGSLRSEKLGLEITRALGLESRRPVEIRQAQRVGIEKLQVEEMRASGTGSPAEPSEKRRGAKATASAQAPTLTGWQLLLHKN